MSDRKLFLFATLSNVVVAVATYALLGWNSAGAHAAARNTARIAVLIFLLGFAQPGLSRLFAKMPTGAALIQAFVCAQVVHFVTVVITVALDKTHFLRHFSMPGLLTVVVGSSVVLGAGLTANKTALRARNILHQSLLYAVFLIFFADYLKHPDKPLRIFALVLAVGLFARLAGQFTRPRVLGAAASSGSLS